MSPSESPTPRVGYVLKMYPRFSETFILEEVLALERHGADLQIFSLRPPADGRFHENLARVKAPVTYLDVPTRPAPMWDAMRRGHAVLGEALARELPQLLSADPGDATQAVELATRVVVHRIDHLHAHFGSIATTVARLAARLAGVTYSFTAHAKDIFHEDVDPSELHRKLADAAFVVTVSDYNLQFLRTTYGASADRVVRVYNGLDLETFSVSKPLRRLPVIVAVGRLVEKKGFDHLVDAVALMHHDGDPVRLEIVGTGAEEARLRAQVAELGLTETVSFLGPLPQARTREVVRGAAVLAAPCVIGADGNRDGLPTVLLEGLALGTPVVATPVTGIPEAVQDERTGLLVPSGDVPALADALARLVRDADLRCRLAAEGRRLVEERFDAEHNTASLLALMQDAVARHGMVTV